MSGDRYAERYAADRIRRASADTARAIQALGEAMARLTEAAGHLGAAVARFKAEYQAATPSQIEGAGHDEDR